MSFISSVFTILCAFIVLYAVYRIGSELLDWVIGKSNTDDTMEWAKEQIRVRDEVIQNLIGSSDNLINATQNMMSTYEKLVDAIASHYELYCVLCGKQYKSVAEVLEKDVVVDGGLCCGECHENWKKSQNNS